MSLPNPAVPAAPIPTCEVYAGGIGPSYQLTHLTDMEFSQPFGKVGTGRIRMRFGDPQKSMLFEGQDIRFVDLDSGDYLFRGFITELRYVVVDRTEEAGEYVEASLVSNAGLFRRALVYPEYGITEIASGPLAGLRLGRYPANMTRYYNWACPALSYGSWPVVTDRGPVCGPVSALGPPFGKWNKPDGWLDMGARWLWSRPLSGSSDPWGTSLFRTFIDAGPGGQITFDIAADDGFALWVGGAPVLSFYDPPSVDGWAKTHSVQLDLSPGGHHIGIEATNTPLPDGSLNPAGILFSAYRAPGTFNSGATETVIANSNTIGSAWRCLDYPSSYPSFTPGAILRDLIFEAQLRGNAPGGALAGVTPDFTNTVDSAGTPWPPAGEFAFKVGDNYEQVLAALTEAWIEWDMPPAVGTGRTLRAWVAQGAPLNGYTGDPMDPAGASPLGTGHGTIAPVIIDKGTDALSVVHTLKGG